MARIPLPKNLNVETMKGMYARCRAAVATGDRILTLDFGTLQFADPVGATALACLATGFSEAGVSVTFVGDDSNNPAVGYLQHAGFFDVLEGADVDRPTRYSTTIEFTPISGTEHVNYLHMRLRPWIARQVRLSADTVESLSACIAEALQKIEHHGGAIGFAMAQHYPRKNELRIAVADRGLGIPVQVRKIVAGIKDAAALRQACVRGFTSKTNFTNRGFGLDNLIRYAVWSNGGAVMIRSRTGTLVARRGPHGPALQATAADWDCPGTLVHIVLRTDTLERSDDDLRPEVFQWF